ncbi:MAG: type II toxin-antitoxin system RelE/ParE family toxin [Planctomycetaceae bacterium]
MSLSLVLRRSAKQDITDATRWYARDQPGREKQFQTQLDKAFERTKEHPTRTALYFQDVRFCCSTNSRMSSITKCR